MDPANDKSQSLPPINSHRRHPPGDYNANHQGHHQMGPPPYAAYYHMPVQHPGAPFSPAFMSSFSPGMSPLFSPSFWNSPGTPLNGRNHPSHSSYEGNGYPCSNFSQQADIKLDQLLANSKKSVQERQSNLLNFHSKEERPNKSGSSHLQNNRNKWLNRTQEKKESSYDSGRTASTEEQNSKPKKEMPPLSARSSPTKEHNVRTHLSSPEKKQPRRSYDYSPGKHQIMPEMHQTSTVFAQNPNQMPHYVAYVPVAVPAPSPGGSIYPYSIDHSYNENHYKQISQEEKDFYEKKRLPSPSVEREHQWHPKDVHGPGYNMPQSEQAKYSNDQQNTRQGRRNIEQPNDKNLQEVATEAVQMILGPSGMVQTQQESSYMHRGNLERKLGLDRNLVRVSVESNNGKQHSEENVGSHVKKNTSSYEKNASIRHENCPKDFNHSNNSEHKMEVMPQNQMVMLPHQIHNHQRGWPHQGVDRRFIPEHHQRPIMHPSNYSNNFCMPDGRTPINMVAPWHGAPPHYPGGTSILPNFSRSHGRYVRGGGMREYPFQNESMLKSEQKMHAINLTPVPKKPRQKLEELQQFLHQLQQVNHKLRTANESLRHVLTRPDSTRKGAAPKRSFANLVTRNALLRNAILELQSISVAGNSASEEQLATALSRCDDLLSQQEDMPLPKIKSKMEGIPEKREGSWSMREESSNNGYRINNNGQINSAHDSAATLLALANNPRTHSLHPSENPSNFNLKNGPTRDYSMHSGGVRR